MACSSLSLIVLCFGRTFFNCHMHSPTGGGWGALTLSTMASSPLRYHGHQSIQYPPDQFFQHVLLCSAAHHTWEKGTGNHSLLKPPQELPADFEGL